MGLIIIIINAIVTVLTVAIILYTLLRMVLQPFHPVVNAMGKVIEPMLDPIRKRVPAMGGLDFSPLILIVVLQILEMILVAIFRSLT